MTVRAIFTLLIVCLCWLFLLPTSYGQSLGETEIVLGSHEPAPHQVLRGQSNTLLWQSLNQLPSGSLLYPEHDFHQGLLRLHPDLPATFYLESGQWLRVSSAKNNVSIWQDNGSGLWQKMSLAPITQGKQQIYFVKGSNTAPSLVRLLANTSGTGQAVTLALSKPQHQAKQYWEKRIDLPLTSVILPDSKGDNATFYRLEPGELLPLPTEKGDYRLRVYPQLEARTSEPGAYTIRLKRQGQKELVWYLEPEITRGEIPVGKSCVIPYGRPQVLNFHLSDLAHEATESSNRLHTNQPVLVALTRLQRPLLNPDANRLPSDKKPWLSEFRVGGIWQQARMRAVNNSYTEAPFYAALWLDQALKKQGLPANDRAYLTDRLLKKHTWHQNLLPQNSAIQFLSVWSDLKSGYLRESDKAETVWLAQHRPEANPNAGLQSTLYTPLNLSGQEGFIFKGRVPVTDVLKTLTDWLGEDSLHPLKHQLIALVDYLKLNPDDHLNLALPDTRSSLSSTNSFLSNTNSSLSTFFNHQSLIMDFFLQRGISAERIHILTDYQNEGLPVPSQGESLGIDLWLEARVRNRAGELVPALVYPLTGAAHSQDQQRLGHQLRLMVPYKEQGEIGLAWLEDRHYLMAEPSHLPKGRSRGELTLASLAQHPSGALGTYSPAFQQKKTSKQYVKARWANINLPAEAKELRVWREQGAKGWGKHNDKGGYKKQSLLSIALQQRVSQRFQLQWSQLDKQDEQQGYARFLYFVQSLYQTGQLPYLPEELQTSTQWSANHWLALLHWFKEQRQRFKQGIYAPSSLDRASISQSSGAKIQEYQIKAKQAVQDQRWLDALSYWNWLSYYGTPSLRLQAEAKKVIALQALGQHYQARQQLKGLYLYGSYDLQQQAYGQLKQLLLAQGRYTELISLEVTHFLRYPNKTHQRLLTELLWQQGVGQYAQQLMLSLPENDRDIALWSEMRFAQGLHIGAKEGVQALQETLQTDALNESRAEAFWLGMQAQSMGHYGEAKQYWSQTTNLGQAYQHFMQQGLLLKQAGLDSKARQRAWQSWWTKHPGPWQWQSLSDNIIRSAGLARIRSRSTGLGQTWHWVLPGQPLLLDSEGIGRIKVEVRPLHKRSVHGRDNIDQGIDTWLYLSQLDQFKAHPVSSTAASTILNIEGDLSSSLIGQTNSIEYQPDRLGEVVWLRSRQPLLVRVFRPAPKYPLALLPEPSSEALQRWLKKAPSRHNGFIPVQQCVGGVSIDLLMTEDSELDLESPEHKGPINDKNIRLAVPAEIKYPNLLTNYREAQTVLSHSNPLYDISDIEDSVESYGRLLQLIWQREHHPDQSQYSLSRASYLKQTMVSDYRLQGLNNRLSSLWRWQAVSAIRASAGQQRVTQNKLVTGSRSRRIQQGLMPSPQDDEQFFSAGQELHYQVHSSGDNYELKLELLPVRFVKAQQVFVDVLLDGKPVNRVRLNHLRNSLAITLALPEGQHGLSLKLSDNWASQLVRSQLLRVEGTQRIPVFSLLEVDKLYFVASHKLPVLLKVQGPALLKIDQLDGIDSLETAKAQSQLQPQVKSYYRFVASGLHQLALKPNKNQQTGLFRVYQQVSNPDSGEKSRIYRQAQVSSPLAKSLNILDLNADAILTTETQPGWPEVGERIDNAPTISILAGYQWQADDGEQQGDKRFNLAVQRRAYSDDKHYQFYELRLSQDNRSDDSVLQLKGQWQQSLSQVSDLPNGMPDRIKAQARIAVQGDYASAYGQVSGRWYLPQQSGLYHRKAGLSHWIELAAFYYALPPENTVDRQLSDQVWSRYKADHSFGIRLSDQLSYPLAMDTSLILRSDLLTNTDLTPDQLDLQLSAWHQAGLWQWGVSYLPEYRFDDSHREHAQWQHRLQVDFNKDYFSNTQSRWQLRGELGLDLDAGRPYGTLYFIRHQSDGGTFDDFPNLRFKGLRMQHSPSMPESNNN